MLGRAVEDGSVDEFTLVMYLHLVGALGDGSVALHQYLVLQAAGEHNHAVFLGILCQELASGLTVGAIEFFVLGFLVGFAQFTGQAFCLALGKDGGIAHQGIHETAYQHIRDDSVGSVGIHVLKVGQHAGGHLLTDADTCSVGTHGRVFLSLHHVGEATEKTGHLRLVHTEALLQVRKQTVGHRLAADITEGVGA